MKKILAIVLAAVFALTMLACTNKPTTEAPTEATTAAPTTAAAVRKFARPGRCGRFLSTGNGVSRSPRRNSTRKSASSFRRARNAASARKPARPGR